MSTLVLVGGTGTLGKAILREQDLLISEGVKTVRVISRDEQKQEQLEKSYSGPVRLRMLLGDCRSYDRMELALKGADYVIHMAAIKMIDRFEKDVPEGFKTNIFGSENVMRAALKNHLKSAILVSTDKAVNPINAYGVSKLAASHLWLWANSIQKKTKFGVCCYGNVFGSRGSVVEAWTKLAQDQKPLPITDTKMTRFFISQQEAARFVLQSLFNNQSTVMVPQMKAAKMTRIQKLIADFNDMETTEFPIIGLRGDEKLHEDLPNLNSETAPQFSDNELEALYKDYLWKTAT